MAVNLEALQKKLNQLSGTNSRKNVLWKPQDGEESTIRLVAFPNNEGQPFKERYFYYNIGTNPGLLSPYQFGKPDPFQELISKLRSDDSKESYELAKKLYPKMRCYAAVVVRGEEDKGVRLWSFGKTVYQDLLKLMLDADFGDITDIKDGFDIKVSSSKAPGRSFSETSIRPRPKASPLHTDKKQISTWLESIPSLDDLYECKTYAELEKIINAWLEDPDGSDGTERGNAPAPQSRSTQQAPEKEVSTSLKDLDDAFADLDDL
jgi:hypothetical protein